MEGIGVGGFANKESYGDPIIPKKNRSSFRKGEEKKYPKYPKKVEK